MRHELKAWPEPFSDLRDLKKKCEVRHERDRVFGVGDTLVLREFDPCAACEATGMLDEAGCFLCQGEKGEYTGREAHVHVTHVQRGFGLPDDLVVLSVQPFQFLG